jgi:hypothetical protein
VTVDRRKAHGEPDAGNPLVRVEEGGLSGPPRSVLYSSTGKTRLPMGICAACKDFGGLWHGWDAGLQDAGRITRGVIHL